MKQLKRSILITLAILSIMMTFTVQAKTIDFKEGSIQYWDMNSGKKFAKKLGLKKKSSKNFDLYYKGNSIIIGTNKSNVSYPKKYIYVCNKGNKNLTFYGIKIGDSKKTIRKKLENQNLYGSDRVKNLVQLGPQYAGFTLKFKNNKLVSWTYQLYPTS